MIDDMGIFRVEVGVENPQRPGEVSTVANVMVDTGGELSWLPEAVLKALGLEPRRPLRFVTAVGEEVERQICFANLYVAGTSTNDMIVFAQPGDMTLLGARTLEGLNLRVDLLRKQLVPAGPIPAAAAALRTRTRSRSCRTVSSS
jgi:predicted aspartyl protease